MQLNLTKSGVVASSAAGQGVARAAFADTGAPVLPSIRDLGEDVCWGRRRQRTRQQRVGRARRQADRVSRLPAGARFRSQVAGGLLVAASAWGAAVDGLVKTTAREARSLVHRALVRGSARGVRWKWILPFTGPLIGNYLSRLSLPKPHIQAHSVRLNMWFQA